MSDKIMFEGPQRWLMLNTSPFPEMREIFTQQDRKIEDVQSIRLESETVQVPSDSPWKSYARTGRDYFIVTFPDCVITFVRDDKGVRLV